SGQPEDRVFLQPDFHAGLGNDPHGHIPLLLGTAVAPGTRGTMQALDSGEEDPGVPRPGPHAPYILIYADDLAISEPNSVAVTLQRYDPFQAGDPEPGAAPNSSADPRVLDFDEKTMQKARRKQWDGPRVCSRRYLKVDFADIGWNEWIISPKSFDAYYCSGACEFPMPKVNAFSVASVKDMQAAWWIVRPSNHATIQSIVRAVGIVPGIPEPCCVPDKMNSLGVLFLDENRNVVLKVYPNMSVETCAC
ncbi:hypothetical protein E2I00_006885, partial [Balaenoptera physalus]